MPWGVTQAGWLGKLQLLFQLLPPAEVGASWGCTKADPIPWDPGPCVCRGTSRKRLSSLMERIMPGQKRGFLLGTVGHQRVKLRHLERQPTPVSANGLEEASCGANQATRHQLCRDGCATTATLPKPLWVRRCITHIGKHMPASQVAVPCRSPLPHHGFVNGHSEEPQRARGQALGSPVAPCAPAARRSVC